MDTRTDSVALPARRIALATILLGSVAAVASAQQSQPPTAEDELAPVRAIHTTLRDRLAAAAPLLDVDLIMEGADFSGTTPTGVRWDGRGERLWFQWKRWDEPESGTWEYRLSDRSLRRLDEAAAEDVPGRNSVWDADRRRAMWEVRDSIRLYDAESGSVRTLLDGIDGARPVAFARGSRSGVVRWQNNLLSIELADPGDAPVVRRLTDVRAGKAPEQAPPTGSQRWLREQQLALFDVLHRREARSERRRERSDLLQPAPLYLDGWRIDALVPSPDLSWVAVLQRQEATSDEVADVPDYVTTSGYTEELHSRIKVGDDLGSRRLGLLEVATGTVGWAEVDLEDRDLAYSGVRWSENSRRALVQARATDNKDRWLAVLTPALTDGADSGDSAPANDRSAAESEPASDRSADDGEAESDNRRSVVIDVVLATHDHDDAWINWSVAGAYGWLPGDEDFYFVSERSGYMHLYRAAASGGDPAALTSGEYEVFSPRLTPARDALVFEASIQSPFEVHAYRLGLDGGDAAQISAGHGRENVVLSRDGRSFAAVASRSNRPWELYVHDGGDAAAGERVTRSASPAFDSYDWIEPEIVHFEARDGVDVPARLYRPVGEATNRPAVIFVHGAGYLHNVHRWWSSYSREYAFHHLLAERGYTVLDIDYRGSAGYGRDWRTAIYRYMGGKDLDDQVDGARYLTREHGVDPERIGIYGGSYGGFITLMALFTAAEDFAAGAALRPVTDWAHYNHPYTSNILNLPQSDAESYWRSSPIYFAEGLDDPLLICHGVIDTNVHFQGVVRLAQRLIELRKENWEVALYPVESHGFVEAASWADEYRRILKLFEDNLR